MAEKQHNGEQCHNRVEELEQELARLRTAYDDLEQRFKQRTRELETANAKLEEDLAERKQAEEIMTKRANELETVARVSVGASTVLDPIRLLQAVVDMTQKNFNLYHVHVYLLNEQGDILKLAAGAGDVGRRMVEAGWQIPLKQRRSLVARAARTHTGVLVNDVSKVPDWMPNPNLPDTHSELAVPMIVGNRVLGVLDVQSDQLNRFSKEDAHIQTTLTAQVAVSLENARLYEEASRNAAKTEELARRLALLNEMGTELSRTVTVDEVFKIMAAKTHMIINGDRMSVVLLNEAEDKFEVFALKGNEGAVPVGTHLNVEGTIIGRAVQQKQVITVPDLTAEKLYKNYRPSKQGMSSLITAPLIISDHVIGALTIESKKLDAYGDQDERLITQIASLVAATIENRRLFEQTQERAAEFEEVTRFLDSIVENIPNMVFVKDAEDLRFVRFNRAGEKLIGLPREEMIGKSDYDFFPEDQADFFISKDREILAEGELLDIPEEPIHTVDKGVRYLHTRKVPILDAAGKPKYLLGISEDITDRKMTEEALLKRAIELETVAQVGVITSTIFDTEQLMQTVVDLTKVSFDLYHVHIYLFDEKRNILSLASGADDIGREMVAQGREILLTQSQSLVARAARRREAVLINDVSREPDFLSHPLLPETKAELALPMLAGNTLLGVLDVQADDVDRFNNEDVRIQTTLAAQVAAVLQNTQLFQQTERALAETEILYHIGTRLNAVRSLDEVLQIIALPEVSPDLASAALLLFDSNMQGWPEYAELVAASLYDESSDNVLSWPIGERFSLVDFPLTKLWLSSPYEPLLVSQVAMDERIDPTLQTMFQQANAQSLAVIPLTLGDNWVGVASLLWINERQFTDRDKRLYHSIAGQTAIVVNNWLLLRQAETRAVQLEKLSHIETTLSKAVDEQGILSALTGIVEDKAGAFVNLAYIDTDSDDQPATITLVSSWCKGQIWPEAPLLGERFQLESFPFVRLFLEAPNKIMTVGDINRDERLDLTTRELASQSGIKAIAIMPLQSGGRWQGVVTFHWPKPHKFSTQERLMFRQLLEPVAAVVASRRAYLAQQQALAETRQLYEVIRNINQAADLEAVVAAIVGSIQLETIRRVVLASSQPDPRGDLEDVTLLSVWARQGEADPPSDQPYPPAILAALRPYLGKEPLFFEDVQRDERLTAAALMSLMDLDILALVVMPLWIGTQQLGLLFLEADSVHTFTESEKRFYASLAQQVAVTIDNQRLLNETKAALAEVEATQRRYTLQAWESYQARQPLKNYEQVREEVDVPDEMPPEIVEVVESRQPLIKTAPSTAQNRGDNGQKPAQPAETKFIVPLTVRDEIIGVLGLQDVEPRDWTPEEMALVEAIAREIAQAAENLRLLDETQQRAAQEKRVNEIGEKIQAAQSLEEALRVAVREVGLSLQAPETTVQLKVEE